MALSGRRTAGVAGTVSEAAPLSGPTADVPALRDRPDRPRRAQEHCQCRSNFTRIGALPQSRCNSVACNPGRQQVETSAALHGSFDKFELIDLAFDRSAAPGHGECSTNRIDIAEKAPRKGRQRAGECFFQPAHQRTTVSELDHGLEAARQTCRPRDVRRCLAKRLDEGSIWLRKRASVRRQKPRCLTGRWRSPGLVHGNCFQTRSRRRILA